MRKLKMKSTLIAATVALSCLVPAASAGPVSAPASFGLGQAIAAQGNAALRVIRAEMVAAVRSNVSLPTLPARPRRMSAPVATPAGGGSIASTAACAE